MNQYVIPVDCLLTKYNLLKRKLEDTYIKEGLTHNVLTLSQELDRLIVKMQKKIE